MKKLYMLIGLPGSGKSTFREEISIESNPEVLSTDDIIEHFAKVENKTYNEVFRERIKYAEEMLKKRINFCSEKDFVIWDQTNLNSKTRASKLNNFPEHKKIAVYFDVEFDIIDKRNEERAKFGRSIPWRILSSMKNSIEAPTPKEGFDSIIIRKFGYE